MDEEKEILQRLSVGDADAFRTIFVRYAPRVEGFALKMLKDLHQAQDVSQNIFAKLWAQRAVLERVQSLDAWLFRMTRNAVLDIYKHHRIRTAYEKSCARAVAVSNDLAERIATDELARMVDRALEKMPARRYEVYRLSRECGKSNREIAEELHITTKSVENHLTKALFTIKKEIS